MRLPPPDSPRALFHLFLFFDAAAGLPSIVDKVAFREPDPRQIYRAVLGRLPESAALSVPRPGYSPAGHLTNALQSAEFQRGFVSLFSNAFPEKKRRIFVHIQKCAGTDLIANVSRLYPSIGWILTHEERTSRSALFTRIGALVREVLVSQDLFIHGHMGLPWVLNRGLVRQTDEVFTTVRDPAEMVLSWVNYVLTRLLDSVTTAAPASPDVIRWTRALGIERFGPNPSAAELMALARRILREPSVVPSNRLCRSLGQRDGIAQPNETVTAQAAHENLVIANAEITDTQRYGSWLHRRFGIVSKSRHNASIPVLSRDRLTADDADYLESTIIEDRKLYDSVHAALALTDAPSVMARELGAPSA